MPEPQWSSAKRTPPCTTCTVPSNRLQRELARTPAEAHCIPASFVLNDPRANRDCVPHHRPLSKHSGEAYEYFASTFVGSLVGLHLPPLSLSPILPEFYL